MARVLPQLETPALVITKAELDQLDTIIGQQPAGFVISIIDFFRLVSYKRTLEAKQQKEKEAAKITTPANPGGDASLGKIEETKTIAEKTNPE